MIWMFVRSTIRQARFTGILACIGLVAVLGQACSLRQPTAGASPSQSPMPTTSPDATGFLDPNPEQFAPPTAEGFGMMTASASDLVFTSGNLKTLYVTSLAAFQPRRLLTVTGKIGPISVAGRWAAFAVYTQEGSQLTPLASWSVYGVDVTTGRSVAVANGHSATELSELPDPTAGQDYIIWDQLMDTGAKVLWRYDTTTGARTQLALPKGMYPVKPSAVGRKLLFLDNSRDLAHANQTWIFRGGEPLLLDLETGEIVHLAPDVVANRSVLTPSRAVWETGVATATGDKVYVQEVSTRGGPVRTLGENLAIGRVWANDQITMWLAPPRGAVTALVGGRTGVVSWDLISSPGGVTLHGGDVYYAGNGLVLRIAHISKLAAQSVLPSVEHS